MIEPNNPRVGAPEEPPTVWCRHCDDQHTEPECRPIPDDDDHVPENERDDSADDKWDDGDYAYDHWKDDNIVAPIKKTGIQMTETNVGGRPRELKDGKVCSFTLDAATRKVIDRHARKMKCSKSEAVRSLIGSSR